MHTYNIDTLKHFTQPHSDLLYNYIEYRNKPIVKVNFTALEKFMPHTANSECHIRNSESAPADKQNPLSTENRGQ